MDQLTRLFAEYRTAIPDPEPGPDFMPGLWQCIEARRSSVLVLRRFAGGFAAVAAAFALLIGVVLIPHLQSAIVYSATYVDVLENEQTSEMALAEVPQPRVP